MADASKMEAALLEFAGIEPGQVCWLDGDDTGYYYCLPCAKMLAAAKAKKAEPVPESDEDEEEDDPVMNEDHIEYDGSLHCETCGCILDYSLTDDGAAEELEHFRTRRFCKKFYNTDAFYIARILQCIEDFECPAWMVKAANRLGQRYLAAIERAKARGGGAGGTA